jgi:hypothetical protein
LTRAAHVVAVSLLLAGCARPEIEPLTVACEQAGGKPQLLAELFFGRSIHGGGSVSDADWSGFLEGVVTPRFPAGLTVFDAHGQWFDPALHRVDREATKVLLIATDFGADTTARLNQVRAAYRAKFGQDSVGLILTSACAAF